MNYKKYMNKKILIICLIIIIIILISFRLSNETNKQIVQEQPTTKTISYSDPANYFSLNFPYDWDVSSDYGRQRNGIGTLHEEALRIEYNNVSKGDVGLNISVYEKTPDCEMAERPNSTLAGLPAYFDSRHYSWTFYNTDSTIVIGYYYPGLDVYHKVRRSAPVTQEEMDANNRAIQDIVSTIKLNNPQMLQCP